MNLKHNRFYRTVYCRDNRFHFTIVSADSKLFDKTVSDELNNRLVTYMDECPYCKVIAEGLEKETR